MMKRTYLLWMAFLATFFLISCSSKQETAESKPTWTPSSQKDTSSFNSLLHQYSNNIEKIWGTNEVLMASPKNYVQYRNHLKTRAQINFNNGTLTIETLETGYAAQIALEKEIVHVLLMPEPMAIIDESREYKAADVPFLFNQVLDHHHEPIRWPWRAEKFAEYLVTHKLQERTTKNGQRVTFVTIHLVPDHVNERALKFAPAIAKQAKKYQLDPKMITAIIEVESNFNPFAVSRSDALGLMQVQQHTAGRDLYSRWGKKGEPSRQFLLDPDNNIMMGSAYLALIRDNYLAGIKNPISMKYAMISSYNGGAGSVLTLFSSDRKKAPDVINRLTPEQVYEKLVNAHSSVETRNYLKKVMAAMQKQ